MWSPSNDGGTLTICFSVCVCMTFNPLSLSLSLSFSHKHTQKKVSKETVVFFLYHYTNSPVLFSTLASLLDESIHISIPSFLSCRPWHTTVCALNCAPTHACVWVWEWGGRERERERVCVCNVERAWECVHYRWFFGAKYL